LAVSSGYVATFDNIGVPCCFVAFPDADSGSWLGSPELVTGIEH